jgi:hypothetical protein
VTPFGPPGGAKASQTAEPDDILLEVERLSTRSILINTIDTLFNNHVGDLIDYAQLHNKLIRDKVPLIDPEMSDCCAMTTYEVKIGSHYRNFTTNSYFYRINFNVPEFNFERKLDETMYKLTNFISTLH